MSTKNDRFRNPERPKECIQQNKSDLVVKDNMDANRIYVEKKTYIIRKLGINNERDVSVYDKFVINSDSEDEDTVVNVNLASHESKKAKKRKHTSRNSDSNNDTYSSSTHDSYRSSLSSKSKWRREPSCNSDYSTRKKTQKLCVPSTSSSRGCRTGEYDKQEIKIPALLYGMHHCDVCDISTNSLSNYNSHMIGKRHLKAVNAQSVVGSAAKSFIPTKPSSKCPKQLPWYYQKKLNELAKIQPFIDENLKTPCPGMHKLKELQGAVGTSYYCSLCDLHFRASSVLSHLSGFKHQLKCVKYFRSDLYEKLRFKEKYQVQEAVAYELRHIERRYGRGLVRVEKDFTEKENPYADRAEHLSQRESDLQSTTQKSAAYSVDYHSASIPDPSKSGYYCRICDSHSNSESMWQSHITGNRHIANLKKAPGAAPSKNKYIAAPTTRAYLMNDLKDIKAPVVGLSQIREIRKPEIDAVTYNCFLCCACISSMDIVDHILSRKHRMKYLESINHPGMKICRSFNMQSSSLDLLVEEICVDVQMEMGHGTPEVYYHKDAICKW